MILICIYNDEPCWAFFHVLLGHSFIFFGKCLLRSFACLLTDLFAIFCYWVVWVLCIFWIVNPHQTTFANMFSPSCKLPFRFLIASFAVHKLFSFMSPYLLFCGLRSRYHIEKSLSRSSSVFSSRSFTVSGLTFKSLICLELILWVVKKLRFQFYSFDMWISNFPSTDIEYFWLPVSQILVTYKCLGLFMGSQFFSIGLCVCF